MLVLERVKRSENSCDKVYLIAKIISNSGHAPVFPLNSNSGFQFPLSFIIYYMVGKLTKHEVALKSDLEEKHFEIFEKSFFSRYAINPGFRKTIKSWKTVIFYII